MIQIKDIKTAYFLGIGGIGMSAIARYFLSSGIKVFGYDKTETILTKSLTQEGAIIHYTEDLDLVPPEIKNSESGTIVVYTPAIPKEHAEYRWFVENNFTLYKRSEVLGIISSSGFTIAIAGTHGKTTTSSLVAHLLKESGINFSAFLGGISSNLQSNYYRYTEGKNITEKELIVVEADEFDRSFLKLRPSMSVITSTDPDHLDIYGEAEKVTESFNEFACLTPENGYYILNENCKVHKTKNGIQYGHKDNNEVKISKIYTKSGAQFFNYNFKNLSLEDIECGVAGTHNIENAAAAITCCLLLGADANKIKNGIKSFRGVKRRFEYLIKTKEHIVIDDYAHHPTELKAIISSVAALYPEKKITGIFQPHLYSRTRDFIEGFADSLRQLNQCYLLDIYPAREKPIDGIHSGALAEKIEGAQVVSKENFLAILRNQKPELLLILGAGDIDLLTEPVRRLYEMD